MCKIQPKGFNRGFLFTQLLKGRKSVLYEVKSIISRATFYHVVLNSNKNYPESEWPERIIDKNEALKKLV